MAKPHLGAKPYSRCLQLSACSRALLQVSTITTIKPHVCAHRSAWHTQLSSPCPSCRGASLLFSLT